MTHDSENWDNIFTEKGLNASRGKTLFWLRSQKLERGGAKVGWESRPDVERRTGADGNEKCVQMIQQ